MRKIPVLSLLSVLFLTALLLSACKADTPLVSAAAPDMAQAATTTPTTTPTSNAAATPQAIATAGPEMLTPTPAGGKLAGTAWIMSSLNGALPAAETSATLQFGNDGTASGSDGCNRYFTTYEEDGQKLTFGQPMGGTMMACAELTMLQAGQYREALGTVTSFTMSARQLVLFAGSDIVLTYVADAQSLEGTAWQVTTYNNGREAAVGLLPGTEITLSFEKTDLNGNAGCNNYFAGYHAAGSNIAVEPPGSTFRFCEAPQGVMEQEAAYLAALQSAASFHIEGDQLWLRTADDAIAVIAVKETMVDLPAPEPQKPTGTVTGANVLNIRSGPGTNFQVVAAARLGDTGTIVGRSQDGRWWVVDAPSLPGGVGWVSVDFVSATNAEKVPVVTSPPTPVPTPTRVPPTATPVRPTATPFPPPPPQAQINFWADRTQINLGECATLFWDVRNVQAVWVYPQGANFSSFGRPGQGNERVCPNATTTYEMRVQLTDGSTQFRHVTINVAQPIAAPQPPIVAPPVVVDPLAGTRWTVTNFNNGAGAVTGLVAGSAISMDFGNDGRITGAAGCNSYFAGYRAGGNSLSVDHPGSTNMFCESPEGVMQQEQQFLAALQSAATFQITGNQLQIRSGGDALAVMANRAP
jgi:heat shock protein HslJ